MNVFNFHLLVVDDEPEWLDFLSSNLIPMGFRVTFVSSAQAALQVIERQKVHVALTDIKLPRMNGLTLLEKIKQADPEIEVVLMTGFGSVESAVEAMRKGAYDYIQKPIHLNEIVAVIEKALEKRNLKNSIALYESSRKVLASSGVVEVLEKTVPWIRSMIPMDEGALILRGDDGEFRWVESWGANPGPESIYLEVVRRLISNTQDASGCLLGSVGRIPEKELHGIAGAERIKSLIFYPLKSQDEFLGAFLFLRSSGDPFGEPEFQSGQVFAAQISLALQNARLYEAFKKKVDELNQAKIILEQTQTHLLQSEKLASIGRLVSGVAHEINNPLTAVIGYAQLMKDCGGQDYERYAAVIYEQAQRAGRIVQDLAIFARKQKPQLSQVDIVRLIEDVVKNLTADIESRKVQVLKCYPAAPLIQPGDSSQLKRVFNNLILNALHAVEGIPGRREIRLSVSEAADQIQITVGDNGMGIAAENLQKIFDPFFTTKEVGMGSGLGLSIAYGVIREHGGSISAASALREGSVFTVLLPKGPLGASARIEAGKAQNDESLGMRPVKVLIVEDEKVIAEYVQKILKDQGFQVSLAADGELAFHALTTDSFDLVLCDYRIPKLNGLQLVKKIEAENAALVARFIFVTGSLSLSPEGGDPAFLKAKNIGCVTKPFTREELMKAIQDKLAFLGIKNPAAPQSR